ncbi:MAG: carboxypeptidase regulatory-like domain-containing protein, partial [Acidobacteria bacterium]|nr:carboxypeptidase regulatory-like domain-containing protein [Acidobacteriota bacterium]
MTTFSFSSLARKLAFSFALLAMTLLPNAARAQSWGGETALGIEVTNKKGKPVEGAEVLLLFVEQEPFAGPDAVVTDLEGFAEGIRLAEGRWRIDVKAPGYASYTVVVRIQPGKKPAITAGPIRDAVAPPLTVRFLKSPKVGQNRAKADRAGDRPRDREPLPPPPPLVQKRPEPPPVVTPPPPKPVPVTPPPVVTPPPAEAPKAAPAQPEAPKAMPAPKTEAPMPVPPPQKAPAAEKPMMEEPVEKVPAAPAPPAPKTAEPSMPAAPSAPAPPMEEPAAEAPPPPAPKMPKAPEPPAMKEPPAPTPPV